MTSVSVGDGIELDYERSGSGPPLLMIMGMSGTALHWGEPFLERVREDFEVFVYDHRGVGRSSRLEGPVTTAQMAEDAAGLLDALELDTAHVLGISMGGMIAQELALAHGARVRTLTLGCTYCGGPGSTPTAPSSLRELSEAMASGDRQRAIRAGWEINVSPHMMCEADAYARFQAIAAERSVAVSVVMAQLRACAAHDTHARLGELAMPTLVIHGSADRLIPVENAADIASRIPGARLEILEGVGHLFFWERPAVSAQLLRTHAGCPSTPVS